MTGAKKGTWIAGSVAAALAIVLGSWFLAINPSLSAAAEVRTQAADTRSQNVVLATKVAKLKADFAKLDQYKADLAALQVQIPTTAQLSEYLRELDKIATARTVTITTVTPGAPQAVILAATKAKAATAAAAAAASEGNSAPAPTPTPSASSTAGAKSAGAAPSAAPGVPDGLAAIPLSITVVGTYDNTLGFLSDIQSATPRLFLVSGFTGTKQDPQEATGGKPALKLGDQELVVNGFMYVLPQAAATAPAPSPSTAATPAPTPSLPAPVSGKNPLIPVGGK